ncbi:hypothetical protein [Ferrovibrio terrae]|uniref:hypothetical protein n=1 Tax=Ferrovibrio terrae TaxID=2594003 RepID=UPI003137A85C
MPLAPDDKNRINPPKKKPAAENQRPTHRGKTMTNAAATTAEIAARDQDSVPLRGHKYDDVVTAEQLKAIDDLVGPIDEADLEDIRQRRW